MISLIRKLLFERELVKESEKRLSSILDIYQNKLDYTGSDLTLKRIYQLYASEIDTGLDFESLSYFGKGQALRMYKRLDKRISKLEERAISKGLIDKKYFGGLI